MGPRTNGRHEAAVHTLQRMTISQQAPPAGVPLAQAPQPEIPRIPLPPEPPSIEATGLHVTFLTDLALKTLYLRGQMTMGEIATAMGLPITNVVEKVMDFLKNE